MRSGRLVLLILGVAAAGLIVASLPLRPVAPDVPASDEVLLRILPGGGFELRHGPTRNDLALVGSSAVPLETPAGGGVVDVATERVLRDALRELRARVDGLQRVRIEIAPDESLRLALRAAQVCTLEGLERFELASDPHDPGLAFGVSQELASIRRSDEHPADPILARLVLTVREASLAVELEGIAAYPVGPAQGDFVPDGSRIKWGSARETEAGRWLCIGYDLVEWESPLNEVGRPTASSEPLQRATATPIAHLYVELPGFDVPSATMLDVLRLLADASGVTPEYLVAGFNFDNALGGR